MGDGAFLSERKKQILKAVVELYTESGEPVGSKFLMESRDFHCSSATLRNEMAELEELGYLDQPHTSAGRIPSEAGYRFYVNSLMNGYRMNSREADALDELVNERSAELDKILDTAARLTARLTNYTALTVRGKPITPAIRRFSVVWVDSANMLLVMITGSDSARTKYFHTPFFIDAGICRRLEDLLNASLANKTPDEVTLPLMMEMEGVMGEYGVFIPPIIKSVYDVIGEIRSGELNFRGVDRLLYFPEYSDRERLRGILGVIENKREILKLVSSAPPGQTNVYIGSENPLGIMHDTSLVFRTVTARGNTVGALGVIGPCRMNYSKVITTIEGVTRSISAITSDQNLLNGRNQN